MQALPARLITAAALGAVALVTVPPAAALTLDDNDDISLGVRAYVNARIATESTDRSYTLRLRPDGSAATNSNGFPIVARRSQTFPHSPAGHIRQNRFFVEAEWKHKLDRLVKKGVGPLWLLNELPFRVRRLRYGLTYRGEFDGIYDWGPSEYRDAWNAGQFPTSEGDVVPANPSAPLVQTPEVCNSFPSTPACKRLVDVPGGRRDLRDDAVHRSRLFQAYIEADLGRRLWVRFGRQIVAWGETDNFRLLDNINPIDSSFGGFLVSLHERRVPLDMLRAQYRIGELGPLYEMFVDAYAAIDDRVGYAPGVPKGSPWTFPNNGEPSPLSQTFIESPDRTFEDMRGGARVVFNWLDATFSLAHYYTYLDRPAVQVAIDKGFPAFSFPDGYSSHFHLTPERTQISGGTATFPVPLDVARFLRLSGQPIIRTEVAYFHDEPRYRQSEIDPFVVDRLVSPSGPEVRGKRRTGDSFNFVLGVDLNQFIRFLNPRQSFFISTQFFYKHLIDAADRTEIPGRFEPLDGEVLPAVQYFTQAPTLELVSYATEPVFVKEPTDQFLHTLLVSTSYMSSKVNPQLTLFYDWGGALVVQPAVTFLYDPFRFTIDYTFIHASTLKGGSGVSLLRDRDNVQLRFEYVL